MKFIDTCFPLLVTVSAPTFDEDEVRAMTSGFEQYFRRGERYALISLSPRNSKLPGQRERKLIADWTGHPRVKDYSKRLCVGTAIVITNPLARAAYTAITALSRPPVPTEIAPSLDRALDYCLQQIRSERLPLAQPVDLMRYQTLRDLEGVT